MQESNRIEFKRELTDSLEKEVVAFLNYRDGGVIYIGIDDKTKKTIGVVDADSLQLKIKDRIKNNISPSTMGLFDVIVEMHDDKSIIKIKNALREAVINAIIHNNYTNEVPPKFELFADRLEITSAGGLPAEFDEEEFFMGYSAPPNKEIMRVFRDLDMVEQLGSGVPRILEHYPRSIYQFTPNFIRLVMPFAEDFGQATDQATDQANKILQFCSVARSTQEIMLYLNLTHRPHFRKTILFPLITAGKLALTIPDKPSSPKQKYVTVKINP